MYINIYLNICIQILQNIGEKIKHDIVITNVCNLKVIIGQYSPRYRLKNYICW